MLISYNGIIPFESVVTLNINGLHFKVEDLYCVRQNCTCKDVHLIVSPFNDDHIILPFESENTEEMQIVYNTQTNKWTLAEKIGLQLNPNDVMSALSELVDIRRFYSLRHEMIRNLYKIYLLKYFEPSAETKTAAIGRNDPCPCGSGNKYKKCCWGKGLPVRS